MIHNDPPTIKAIWEFAGCTDPQWEPDYDCFVTYWEPCLVHVEHEPESETHGERWLLRINDLNALHEIVGRLDWHQKLHMARLVYWMKAKQEENSAIHVDDCMVNLIEASPDQIVEALRKVIGS